MIIQPRRSVYNRIVFSAIAVSLVLVFALWLLTDHAIRTAIEDATQRSVDVDLAGLVDIYASGGEAELRQRISDRLALIPSDGSVPHYLLADGSRTRIVGDLGEWPALDPDISERGRIAIGVDSNALARATRLAPDLHLVVARETADSKPILRQVGLVFLLGGGLFVVIVAILGRLAALRLQTRIERINSSFRDREADEMIRSMPTTPTDEIDELAVHSAAVLSRVTGLMEAYRDTTERVAHEIRTPLMHLDGKLVKALASNPASAVEERLAEARQDIRRLIQLLESLLDIAANKARKGEITGLASTDLSLLTERICELYADSAEESGHVFPWDIVPGVELPVEEAQFARLVTNLLDNAFKYVPAGGEVRLSLEPGPKLVVQDSGPGIAPEERQKIFERFYRGKSGTQDAQGNGLGLALAQAIAIRHGLEIELEDTMMGACFVVARRDG